MQCWVYEKIRYAKEKDINNCETINSGSKLIGNQDIGINRQFKTTLIIK